MAGQGGAPPALVLGVLILAGLGLAGLTAPRAEPTQADAGGACQSADWPMAGGGADMVWVPAGTVTLGDTIYPEEGPLRAVPVEGFWMDRDDVTNAQFAAFVRATGYVTEAERGPQAGALVFVAPEEGLASVDPAQWWRFSPGANWRHPGGPGTSIAGRERHPVVAVTWRDARAYARWRGRDLPTEAQWEWAARGGAPNQPGDPTPPRAANTWRGAFPTRRDGGISRAQVTPVGCYPANGFGLRDMTGNVWQWTADAWFPGHHQDAGDLDDAQAARHVIKGGSYLCAPNYCLRYRPGARQGQETGLPTSHIGFRTILTVQSRPPASASAPPTQRLSP